MSYRMLGRLSTVQRDAAMNSDSDTIKNAISLGDEYNKIGNYVEEARQHRFVQEQLTNKFYDRDSQNAWKWNCTVIHRPDLYPPK
jgi:hypothetical protein